MSLQSASMNCLFKKIGLVCHHDNRPATIESLLTLAEHLIGHGIKVLLDKDSVNKEIAARYTCVERQDLGKLVDLVIVLGGDGTMLGAARLLAPYRVPLIGINQGRLGFMTDIPLKAMFGAVDAILKGQFIPEDRILLSASVMRNDLEVASSLALNDIVFSRGGTGQLIEFEVFIDNQFVYTQRSDGLIVSTPTGSTAYSLAAGGPILHPTLPALALVPVCPQSMSNRPIVLNDSCIIEVILTRGLDARVHFDGHTHHDLNELDRIIIRRHQQSLRLLHPMGYNHYDTLRHKLHWGERLI